MMMSKRNRVRDYRHLHALTQGELAKDLGVTQALVSQVERGLVDPDPLIQRIVECADVPTSFFQRGRRTLLESDVGSIRFRRLAKSRKAVTNQATTLFAELYDVANLLADKVGLSPTKLVTHDRSDVHSAARETRRLMGIGDTEPVGNVIRRCENVAILVVCLDLGSHVTADQVGHDGMSAWEGPWDRPVIGYFPTTAGDRLRFTVAHELGHLVLHQGIVGDELDPGERKGLEAEANQFAGTFLVSTQLLQAAIADRGPTLKTFQTLKAGLGVSIGALVMTAAAHGLIDDQRKAKLWRQISSRGWRREEPVKVHPEEPVLFGTIVRRAMQTTCLESLASEIGLESAILTRAARCDVKRPKSGRPNER